ncbi:MAG: hypothetical protein AVDCRST_MAG73-2816, partial [uncultured Thermomicrobiales bacterium]
WTSMAPPRLRRAIDPDSVMHQVIRSSTIPAWVVAVNTAFVPTRTAAARGDPGRGPKRVSALSDGTWRGPTRSRSSPVGGAALRCPRSANPWFGRAASRSSRRASGHGD